MGSLMQLIPSPGKHGPTALIWGVCTEGRAGLSEESDRGTPEHQEKLCPKSLSQFSSVPLWLDFLPLVTHQ